MPLTPTDTQNAYQMILGREASEEEIAHATKHHETLLELRRTFLNSEEFARKYKQMRDQSLSQSHPVLVHLHVPKTAGTSLAHALADIPQLQPNRVVHDGASLDEFCKLPRAERQKLRYIRGHLSMGAGDALGLHYRYLCLLRKPGPRMFSFYQFIKRTTTHPSHQALEQGNMSFGDYLEFSLSNPNHRVELDNGQVRRLSGEFSHKSLGQESRLLRLALSKILEPTVILGLVEHMDALISNLVAEGYLTSHDLKKENVSPNSELYDESVAALTPDQRALFENYTAYDTYFYETCRNLLSLPEA